MSGVPEPVCLACRSTNQNHAGRKYESVSSIIYFRQAGSPENCITPLLELYSTRQPHCLATLLSSLLMIAMLFTVRRTRICSISHLNSILLIGRLFRLLQCYEILIEQSLCQNLLNLIKRQKRLNSWVMAKISIGGWWLLLMTKM